MNTYKGTIVKESLTKTTILKSISIANVEETDDENPKDRWHIYYISSIDINKIKQISALLKKKWYAHFWSKTELIVAYPNKIFKTKRGKKIQKEIIDYGKKQGIPEEQLDFVIDEEKTKPYLDPDFGIEDIEKGLHLFEIGLEMATVCSPGCIGKKKCRIFIRENPDDHGSIGDGKRYIPDAKSPAHAHVFDSSGKLVGFLNITGPRPRNENDVWEYRKSKKSQLDAYREDIVNWANEQKTFEEEGVTIYNWSLLRQQWKEDHPPKPFKDVVK